MTKEAFEGKLNALVPQPDPEITAALFAFGQELGQEEACDGVRELLNSMSFVSRHFSAVTTQSVYEIIQHGSAARQVRCKSLWIFSPKSSCSF